MKKIFYPLFFGGFSALFLFLFIADAFSATVPFSGICQMSGEYFGGKTPQRWCIEAVACYEEYNFCYRQEGFLDRQYHFGCEDEAGLGFCTCDSDNAWYEDCQYGCENGQCSAPPPPPGTTPPGTTPPGTTPPGTTPPGTTPPGGTTGGWLTIDNPLKYEKFDQLLNAIINFIFWVGITLAPIMFIIAGFMFVTAAGIPQRLDTAKRLMLYTAIGLAVLLLARGLVAVLKSIIGVE